MPTRTLLAAVLAVGLLLTGCAAPASVPDAVPPTPSASSSSEPAAPVLDSMLVSVDGVMLANDDDSVAGTAAYSDGVGLVALLTDAFGAEPVVEDTGETFYPVVHYSWGDDAVIVSIRGPYADGTFGDAWIRITVPEYAGLAIYSDGGVTVGTDRAAVEVLAPYDVAYDGDGDGASDSLGLTPTPVPGTESLSRPGEVGTAYVEVFFTGDTVTWLRSPANDYSDV
jgi:hypothetical protein